MNISKINVVNVNISGTKTKKKRSATKYSKKDTVSGGVSTVGATARTQQASQILDLEGIWWSNYIYYLLGLL